jgi:hypothetical protein
MDALAAKYRGQVKFLLVYGFEIHAEDAKEPGRYRADKRPVIQSRTPLERWSFAKDFRSYFQLQRQVLVDNFDRQSAAWRLLGSTHYTHSLVVLDVQGKTAFLTPWAKVKELDDVLTKLLANHGRYASPYRAM